MVAAATKPDGSSGLTLPSFFYFNLPVLLRIGDNSQRKLECVGSKWHLHALLHDGSTYGLSVLKERLIHPLRYFEESTDSCLLVQVWAPVNNKGRSVLTTSGQPFVLDHRNTRLLQKRPVSMMYTFSTEGSNVGEFGLPGPVFRLKVPEWRPNVQYYSSKEYPLLIHAMSYNVCAAIALPVFDPHTKSCVAVVELILISKKVNFESEVDLICKGLEAVNLTSSYISFHPSAQVSISIKKIV
ncbi:protein NLP3-like [Triticum dicoccoides]|uniref:protein NLP3-like n=1 Tax=Triticum dicoccoides TaxID=85692 RepID=UPI0018904246|nr:protein NLP3-like [Triticum dicoccoides]